MDEAGWPSPELWWDLGSKIWCDKIMRAENTYEHTLSPLQELGKPEKPNSQQRISQKELSLLGCKTYGGFKEEEVHSKNGRRP